MNRRYTSDMKLNEYRVVFGEASDQVPDATRVVTYTTVTDWQGQQHTVEQPLVIPNGVLNDPLPLGNQLAHMIEGTLWLIHSGEFKVNR